MIYLAFLDEIKKDIKESIRKTLDRVFSVGCEPDDQAVLPKLPSKGSIDAAAFLSDVKCGMHLKDDIFLLITTRHL